MDLIELLNYYVRSELIVVIPVLYIFSKVLSKTKIKKNRIPVVLLVVSLVITACYTFSICSVQTIRDFCSCMFSILTQGVLLTGGSLYIDTFRFCVGADCDKENKN